MTNPPRVVVEDGYGGEMGKEREVITAWITKYALTKGVQRFEGAVVCADISAEMLQYSAHGYAHGCEWHRTEKAAIARAEEMRKAKIEALKKQIAKLEKLRFSAAPSGEEARG